jgi:outer membrane protein assembly factor BamE (lipoprotein component of BamABCDE complex)
MQRLAVGFLLACALCLLSCCQIPNVFCRIQHGNWLAGSEIKKVKEGMTQEEVEALLGPPHNRHDEGGGHESWTYYTHPFGFFYDGIQFGPDGRVSGTWS